MSVGLSQIKTGLSVGTDYSVRVPIGYDKSCRAQPRIYARDVTNGQYISWLDAPKLVGTHDGGDGQAALSDSSAPYWSVSLVGAVVYNITDGSSAVITASGASIVGALSGGTDNDWDDDDEYRIIPNSEWIWDEPLCFELPTVARHGVASDCVACETGVINLSDGELSIQQVVEEVNLVDNGGMEGTYDDESGGGGGTINVAPGWNNRLCETDGTDELSRDAGIFHSGTYSQKIDVDAAGEGIQSVPQVFKGGIWYAVTVWLYRTAGSIKILDPGGTFFDETVTPGAAWTKYTWIVKATENEELRIVSSDGAATFYVDDVSVIELDDVSLTVTPASEVNSTENGGLRVDGRDTCPQPPGSLGATLGKIKATYNPRHSAADILKFGQAASYLFDLYEDANNYIRVYWSAANTLTLAYNANGAGEVTDTWDATGLWAADDEQAVECQWDSSEAIVKVDGIERLNIAGAVVFATDFTQPVDWGSRQDGTLQFDGVISVP